MINSKVRILAETYPTVSKLETGYLVHKRKKTKLEQDTDAILIEPEDAYSFIALIDNQYILVGLADFEQGI